MLTPEQIDALNILCERAAEPVTEFLLKDIARRIAKAGQFTSSAAYQTWKLQELNVSRKQVEKELSKKLGVSQREIRKLIRQSAEVGYNFDISRLPVKAIPFSENESLQQIIKAAVELADEDFRNITNTLGMVDPYGKPMPLKDVYNSCCDFAFNQVVTGATDYNTAIRRACKNIANEGLISIKYGSGVKTSLEAAVRRNIMGGLGLMQEKISQENHDKFGANGWEISAHAASAPDHEPIQGKQYTDEEYKELNNSLARRIGTLNCGHAAFSIILGVSKPTYTDEQIEEFKRQNAEGVTYQGKHYTLYEATQKQRQIERAIRTQKRRVLTAEATGDKERLLTSQIKYRRLNEEYERFSKGVGLRTQTERLYVEGFTPKHGKVAAKAYKDSIAKSSESGTIDINIDEFVPCLKDAETGEILATETRRLTRREMSLYTEKDGWGIDWKDRPGDEFVRGVFIKGDDKPQGLIALRRVRNAVYISFCSTAPQNNKLLNNGKQKYLGVGGHLFADAIMESLKAGSDTGCVYGYAVNEKVLRHYVEVFGAEHFPLVHEFQFIIEGKSAQRLLDMYNFERR